MAYTMVCYKVLCAK